MTPPVTAIEDLKGRKVALFPNDTYPKVGEVMSVSPSGILLRISPETSPESGYSPGETAYFHGAFALKVVG